MDDQVEQRLKNNPKVRVEGDQYAYQVRNAAPDSLSTRCERLTAWLLRAGQVRHQEPHAAPQDSRPRENPCVDLLWILPRSDTLV